ncbi:uncharacterized protein LOC110427623 [Herrania umbratica]|uniref:Uncharacterized protein LOC110427623 n=1 Tax=Herrania umbratica TaxID=108875 RepID=A0A6J1BHR9_9ROSI|nr:uncharacterized protein LOC110427623 [Herrania umbratica]
MDEAPVRKLRSLEDVYNRCQMVLSEPSSFDKASLPNGWMKAIKVELDMIEKNKTRSLIDRPSHCKVIGVKWLYKNKLNSGGTLNKHKPKLMVMGFSQQASIDYQETSTTVARIDTIRLLVALSVAIGFKLFHVDVKSAFLNGKLEEEIYIEQSPKFVLELERIKLINSTRHYTG